MKALVSLMAAFGLGACAATVTEYRQETPTLEYVTAKSPQLAVQCLGGQFERMGDAATLTASGVGQTLGWARSRRMFVDVIPEGTGSRVVYHQHGVIDAGTRYRDAVDACRD